MDGITLLREAKAAGLSVIADGDRLVVRGPRRAEPVVRKLIARKADVLRALAVQEHLKGLAPVNLPLDWWQMWDERAAIREYNGGLPRERAEALALQDVLAQMQQGGAMPTNAT